MAVNRERKIVNDYVDSDFDLEYLSLQEALGRIKELIAKYGKTATIRKYYPEYSDSEYLGVYVDRPETDKEMAARIHSEEQWEAHQARLDAEDYARLKAKFGDK